MKKKKKKDNYFISNGLTTYPFHLILRDLDLFTELVMLEYLAELTIFAWIIVKAENPYFTFYAIL